ncbi:MAG: LysR family transcriptional regulator [Janthinobacterium lividum]
MDFALLRLFATLAREGNLTRSAELLHLTQPTLSLQLKRLQESVGLTLFERTPRGMRLTPTGTHLHAAAERVLAAVQEFETVASGLSGAVLGTLKIGTIVDPEFLRLGPFLKRLHERYPRLVTHLQHGVSGAIRREISADRLDVAFTLGPRGFATLRQQFHMLSLSPFLYRVIAPSGWESRVHGRSWTQLAELPWIGSPPESVHNQLLNDVFRQQGGLTPRFVAQVDVEPFMLDLVRSGVGLSLARESIALQAAHAKGIVVADAVQVEAELGFLCRRERQTEAAISAAFDLIAQIWPTSA